jgi:uncharacterized protein (TIGR03086 family)
MDSKRFFVQAVQVGGTCVPHISEAQLGNATPCSEWDLRALLNHMVYELLWMPDILAGKTVAEVGDKYDGDVLKEDPKGAWQSAAEKANAAVEQADPAATVHLSYGDVPASDYITEVGVDILVHGWDVGQAISCTLVMGDNLAKHAYAYYLPRADAGRKNGSFGPAVPVSDDTDIQTKLLGLLGRSVETWQRQPA